ncbi:MAG: hypothetical protein Q4D00_06020 [Clostridia bacterium]|nr:hypothetical protein [Clostridia bacterium]
MKEKIVRVIKRICFLPPIPTFIIALPSYAFLIVALTGKIHKPVLDDIAYILSAYALVISITGISKIVTFARNGVSEHPFMKWLLSVPVAEKLIHENRFRTEIALYPGFCINVLYVIFKTATGIYYRSAWFLSLGVYYLALAIMRFLLIHYIRLKKETSDKNEELRRYRMCGCMLFLINIALVGITILAVKKNAGFSYPGYLIYVMAMYAFYSVITAVMNLVKYRKYGSPILSAAKVINMSTALVSIFSLETAMLAQFGSENTEYFRVMMTALTGTGVSLIVLGMAVFMIVWPGVLIKRNTEDGK